MEISHIHPRSHNRIVLCASAVNNSLVNQDKLENIFHNVPFTIKQPRTTKEFEQYYHVRWRLLRAPWGEPEGSEIDDIEDNCFHILVMDADKAVGVGRLQYNSVDEAQIRYMAVAREYERKGIGRMIVGALEQEAKDKDVQTIVLDAREPAVGFYQKLGYRIEAESYLLFGEIQHYRMKKSM